ncbi:hypothetical protein GCM10009676_22390 [Prauserella halophila]|uniref:DUF222 domain-containing protein n=1 Tax=Prauserella halophila TaxID=185641 RepID=A0ABP4GYH1_9PSEU|nr:DUF222 domain-containing protein [Prauserella halophila]
MGERDELIQALRTARDERARADAAEMVALARLAELDGGDVRSLADEVAPELGVSTAEAAQRVGRGTALVQRMPAVLGLMQAGRVEAYGGRRLLDVTAPLSDEHARQVDELLSERLAVDPGASLVPANLARRARRLVERVDPGGQIARAREARSGRSFELTPGEHAMSRFTLGLPAEIASAIAHRVDALARRLRARSEDERTLDQLRADIAADLLLGRNPGVSVPETAASVFIHLPVDTALGITDDGCELDGYGPVPGPIAREIMANPKSVWRAVLCDPGTGRPVDLGRARRHPTAAVRELVAVRDRECCIPWCHRPARRCDFDHDTAWTAGGSTSTTNGSPKCDHHHARKSDPGWSIHRDPDTGITTVTTPNGATHTTAPEPVLDPTRRAPTCPPARRQSIRQQPRQQPHNDSRRGDDSRHGDSSATTRGSDTDPPTDRWPMPRKGNRRGIRTPGFRRREANSAGDGSPESGRPGNDRTANSRPGDGSPGNGNHGNNDPEAGTQVTET